MNSFKQFPRLERAEAALGIATTVVSIAGATVGIVRALSELREPRLDNDTSRLANFVGRATTVAVIAGGVAEVAHGLDGLRTSAQRDEPTTG